MGMSGRPYQVLRASSAGAFHGLSTSDITPRMRACPRSAAAWVAARAATSSHHWPKSVSMISRGVACGEADTGAGAAATISIATAKTLQAGMRICGSYDDQVSYIDLMD